MAQKQLQPVRISTKKPCRDLPESDKRTELKLIFHQRLAHPEQARKAQPETTVLILLTLFLIFNIGCVPLNDVSPEGLLMSLGATPNVLYVNLAYALFVITEIILILTRFGCEPVVKYAWRQLAFMFTFYLFYWLSGSMAENFVLLFATGFGLLLSEYIRLFRLTIKTCATEVKAG